MKVRAERPHDAPAIAALTREAFRTAAHTNGNEHRIPGELREAGQLALSLVAEDCDALIGHVAFSPVTISDGSQAWYGLGPISVLPARQGQGIGARLVREGLNRLRALGARGCAVLGEPAYYARFGFVPAAPLTLPGPPPEYFQRIVFAGEAPYGVVSYPSAFG